MIFEKRLQHIKRYREIALAFSKSGFGYIVEELGLDEVLSLPKRLLLKQDPEHVEKTRGERIRLFLEEMGPTFVKIGQVASTRPDLVPEDIINELSKLQSHVPPFPYEEVEALMEESLGARVSDIFDTLEPETIGSASIGQVHRGVLTTGEAVAVKVQRPNIEKIVRNDLEILHNLAMMAESRLEWARQYQLMDMIEEFSRAIIDELDYTIEGRNTEKIGRQFTEDETVHIPAIFWDVTTKNVLVMEYIDGIGISDFNAIEEKGYSRERLAERLTHAIFHQILIEGFFHGDPHPGNITIMEDEVIGFMDFGMVGKMTKEMKANFGSLLIAMMRKDADGVVRAITHMGVVPDEVDMKALKKDAELLRDKYYDIPLSRMNLGEAVQDIFDIANTHRIKLPTDFTMLGKTILTLESIVRQLDPDFSIVDVAEPFGRQLLKERYNPKNITDRAWHQWLEFSDDLKDASSNLHQFSKGLKKKKVPVELELRRSEQFMKRLDRLGNRLSFSIVLLSFSIIMVGLIISSALSDQTNVILSIPAVEIGSVVALIMFIGMIYSIFRSGRF
ncbi:ABC1 kinase family protein [Salinicoccus roseus]|uniref:ABC1 kinase family protein n=1 Tax=Salinicoccus roseus TaxID=45670 RepID=UPI000F50C350|nr:AarF/ABC1/UbiB kinase family protein [Salinicoccus roseus]RPE54310.1 2-octaprenylphenol hydroxylase [Salinicoccus roseus]GGA66479.1 ABC transporter [Salinicoccus roseus]